MWKCWPIFSIIDLIPWYSKHILSHCEGYQKCIFLCPLCLHYTTIRPFCDRAAANSKKELGITQNFKIRDWNAIQKEKNWMLAPGNDKHWKKGMCLLHSASMVLPRRSAMPPLRLSIAWLVGRVRLDIIWFGPDPSSMEQKGLVKKLRVRWGGSV